MKKNFAALSRKVSTWIVAPLVSVGLIFGAVATPANAATSYTELPGTNLLASITTSGYTEFNIDLGSGIASSLHTYSLTYSPSVNAILSTTFDYQNQQILILAETNTTPMKVALYKLPLSSRAGSSISLTGTTLTRNSADISSQATSSSWTYRVVADNSGTAYFTEFDNMNPRKISSLNLSTGVASASTALSTTSGNAHYQCVLVWNTGSSTWGCWHGLNSELYELDPITAVVQATTLASASNQIYYPEFDSLGNIWGVSPTGSEVRTIELSGGATSNNPYAGVSSSDLPFQGQSTIIRLPATAPVQTTGLSATAGDSQVTLSWTAPSNGGAPINDYVIEKSANGSSGWTTIADGTSTLTSYTVTGLSNGTITYFRVSAKNSVGTGTASATVSGTPVAAVVSTPSASTPATSSAAATVAVTKTYSSKPIDFSLGTSSISATAKKNLKAAVAAAGASGKYTITGSAGQVTGVSDKAVNALAKKRANILKAYLVKLGVSKSSITIKTKVVKQGKKPKASVLALY
jgi:outer membrane protein OmpA-like peptidoglycan-associated protein